MSPLLPCLVLTIAAPHAALDKAKAALADFRAEAAVKLLEIAKGQGPYDHATYVSLYENLGIAYAYLERTDDAVRAFQTMLALEPSRAISYTLSPKVTFLFEKARALAAEQPTAAIDLSWSRDLVVDDPIPIDVEVVSDPKRFLSKGTLNYRLKGESTFTQQPLEMPSVGESMRLELPAIAQGQNGPRSVELFLIARDGRDNEVLRWGSMDRPRSIDLRFEPPDPWYGKWWVWAVAGAVVATAAGGAVYVATRAPGASIDAVIEVAP